MSWSPGFGVEAKFHRRVRADLDAILASYYSVSRQLGDDFYAEFQIGVRKAVGNPQYFHFDRSGSGFVSICSNP